ncbi:MAG: enoyl-CoA hydratase/isomerase family protein [Desulfamplus sp.]
MSVIEWKKDKTVAIATMCNGANRQNLEFAETMNRVFDEVLSDTTISSLVITSSDEKNFSQGVDVEWMIGRLAEKDLDSIKGFMYGMNTVFKRILTMPIPVIAAINGHAFGNGAIISCACDFRFMRRDRGFFCFPEVDISIPFLPGMLAFIRKAIPEYKFNELILTGKRVTADELERHHIIEKSSADITELNSDVMAFARTFQKKRSIFAEHKKRMHKSIIDIMDQEDPQFIGLKLFLED